jgi:hypothetical protein
MNIKKETNLQTKPQKSEVDNRLDELLTEMPEALKLQMVNILNLSAHPNQKLKADFLASLQSFDMLTQTDSAVKPFLPEGTNEESLAKALSKVDDSQSILETEQLEGAAIFNSLFESFAADPLDDIQEIRRFANAANLHEAFGEEGGVEALALLHYISEDSAELIHAVIACQIAGMPKQANFLFQMFTKRQFVDANKGYQSLQTEVTKHKGAIEAASQHSKKGQQTRHIKNNLRREFALGLYRAKSYKNPKQATEKYFPKINQYAKEIEHQFTSDYQGFQTVYRWFLNENRNQST